MSKKWLFSLVVAIVITVFSIVALSAKAQPSSVVIQTTATATTTMSYMTPGTATTTYQFDSASYSSGKVLNMQGIDSGSMMIQFAASSSAASLAYQFQYSNNNIDWYGESSSFGTVSGSNNSLFEASSTITHIWTPGVTGTSTKLVTIPVAAAQHERVVFSIPVGTANGAVYAEIDLKRNPSTP